MKQVDLRFPHQRSESRPALPGDGIEAGGYYGERIGCRKGVLLPFIAEHHHFETPVCVLLQEVAGIRTDALTVAHGSCIESYSHAPSRGNVPTVKYVFKIFADSPEIVAERTLSDGLH